MQSRVTFEYSIVRLVPRVEREEFINIGVILFSKTRNYLNIKYHIDEERIKAFHADIDLDLINRNLQAWDLICKGDKNGGKIALMDITYRFRWLASQRSTILQTSRVHPGLCVFPEKYLDELFEKYVLI